MSARARPSPRGLGWPRSAGRSVLASAMARAGGRLRPRPKSPGRRRGMGIFLQFWVCHEPVCTSEVATFPGKEWLIPARR